MPQCANCGASVSEEEVFCGECGARIDGGLDAPPTEAAVAVTDAVSGEVSKTSQKSPLPFIVVGCAAVLVVTVVCGALALILANRSQPADESVFLGGSALPTATRAPRVNAPTWLPIYEEIFDDNAGEWSVREDEQGGKGVEGGVYYITIHETEWASWGTSGGFTFADGVIEVQAQAVEGPNDNGYGLVFRYQDNDNFYYYEVSSDGYYSIGKMVADEWETLVGWTESDVLWLGRASNTLRVECNGSRMTFFVNDYQLEALTDDEFEAGSVGFMAEARDESGVRVHFDNLKVWAAE